MSGFALESVELSKNFKTGFLPKPVQALKEASFVIPKGAVTGLLGPNGSGKSTFIKIAVNLISASSGQVSFFGGKSFEEIKHKVGFVPEKPNYPSVFSGLEVMKLQANLSGAPLLRVEELVEKVGLSQVISRPFQTYSKGMKQRLAIAQSLLSDPDLLILDEPLSGLDPDGREALIQVIQQYSLKKEKTVLLSSHLLEDLQRICNHLVVLKSGEVVFSGDPSSVFAPKNFKVHFRLKDQSSGEQTLTTTTEKLNEDLSQLIAKEAQILQVEPEMQSISYLYFKLINQSQKVKEELVQERSS